jgi:antitoxin ParD1/3/4
VKHLPGATALHRLAKFCHVSHDAAMSTMNISLPESLKSFVDDQVGQRDFGTASEYLRELIRRDQDRVHLRGLLLEGAASRPSAPAGKAYFLALLKRVQGAARSGTQR